jgi:acyl carrier protein
MFSSMSSVLPGVEMSAYAAANSFLDSLAHYRRSLGLPALTIDWGPWSGPGMGEARTSQTSRSGVALMDSRTALECMSSLMNARTSQVMAADIQWPVFRPLYESGRACSILEEMPVAANVTASPAVPEIARLRSAPRSQQRDLLEQYVRNQVLGILGIDRATGLDSGKRLFDAGLDSLRAVELRNRLQSDLECALPSTLTLNYPTIESIAGFLAETLPFLQKSSDKPMNDTREVHPNAQDVAGLSEDEMRRIINEELAKVSKERMR